MNLNSMNEVQLQNLYVKCAADASHKAVTSEKAKHGCGVKASPTTAATSDAKCCEGHASTVKKVMDKHAAEGYLMNLYKEG